MSDTAVQLPRPLVERVEARVSRTQFDSPAEYVAFVLEEVLYQAEAADDDREAVDEAAVVDRLESLGYLQE